MTEVLHTYQDHDASADEVSKLDKILSTLRSDYSKHATVHTASAGGRVIEEPKNAASGAGKWKLAVTLIGWQSAEAHEEFMQTEKFHEICKDVRESQTISGADTFHVKAVEYGGGGSSGVGAFAAQGLPSVQGEVLNPQQQKVKVETVREGPPPAE